MWSAKETGTQALQHVVTKRGLAIPTIVSLADVLAAPSDGVEPAP